MKIKHSKLIEIILTIVLIIFFEPQIFKEQSFYGVQYVDYIYKVLKIIGFLFVSYIYLESKIKNGIKNVLKENKLLLSVLTLQIIGLISTIIHKGDIFRFAGPAITTITMVMIAEILILRKNIIEVLKKVNIYFRLGFIINLISVILVDFTGFKEICSVYFFGIDNRFIFQLLPWVVFEGIVSIYENEKLSLKWLIIVIASEILLLYKFSVAAMLAFGMFILIFCVDGKFKLSKYSIYIYIFYILTNISIIFFKIQNKLEKVILFLKKDITLAGRTYIWDAIIKQFYKYPILGYGMQAIEFDKSFFYNSTAPYYLEFCKVVHAHNSLMTLLYRGGIASVLIYLLIVKDCLVAIKRNFESKYANLLLIAIIIILITSIFDTMDFSGLYFIIALAININKLGEVKDEAK